MRAFRLVPLAAFTCGAVVALWVSTPTSVSAHTSNRNYIQHRLVINAGPTNIDVTLELTFYEHCSVVERARIDTNHDGRISQKEIRAYLLAKARSFEKDLGLSLDDKPLDLVPLYEPSLDLLGETRVREHSHVLRLYYFARTPQELTPGSVLALKDGLWANTGAIRTNEITGTGGFRFSSVPAQELGVWRARFEAVPARGESTAPSAGQDQQ